jgi:hypothetical protein
METWVENPVVAPQSRWNMTARQRPSGEAVLLSSVFWQPSEQLLVQMASATSAQ